MLFLVLGCPYIDGSAVQARIDADGDGVVGRDWGGDDCDDANAEIGAPTPFYADVDGDGHGSTGTVQACAAGPGAVENADDCDDANAAIYPGATELCATLGMDDDCDGLVDLADSGVPDAVTTYRDGDNDEVGDAEFATIVCDASGLATATGDCDDADPTVYPGAIEICLDRVDNDCDSTIDECTAELLDLGINALNPFEGVGKAVVGNIDLDGDGVLDIGIPAPFKVGAYFVSSDQLERGQYFDTGSALWDFRTDRPSGGADFVVGPIGSNGEIGLVASSPSFDDSQGWGSSLLIVDEVPQSGSFDHDWVMESESGRDGIGTEFASRDIDNDGTMDVLTGAPYGDSGCGVAYLFYPPFNRAGDSVDDYYATLSQERAIRFTGTCNGTDYNDYFGTSLAFLGQGGDHGSVAVGAPNSLDEADNAVGSVVIWHVDASMADSSLALESAAAMIFGEQRADHFGQALASGDFDGDGSEELAIGADYAQGDAEGVGAAYVFLGAGSLSGVLQANQADVRVRGPDRGTGLDNYANFGFALALDGDMNGDGYADLAIGAPQQLGINEQVQAGAVWVCPGSLNPVSVSAGLSCSGRIGDSAIGNFLGWSVAYAGDLDADGRDELLIGEPGFSVGALEFGRINVWFGADL